MKNKRYQWQMMRVETRDESFKEGHCGPCSLMEIIIVVDMFFMLNSADIQWTRRQWYDVYRMM
jgi:hypothetical protein